MRLNHLLALGCVLVAATYRLSAADRVIITEFMAASSGPLLDEDGDTSDWIELFNAGPAPVNLDGWRLTDDPDDFGKWIFPATNLPPSGYLVVFASGKNRAVTGARLHTSFSLDADGEYLALIEPDAVTVAFEYAPKFPEQYLNVSYGLDATNTELQHFFATPTPGALNATNYFVQVADTKFDPDRGFYETNFAVTITCATPGAAIRYTLNGTVPTATNGFNYVGPIPVTNTTTLRAAAFRDGYASSDVDTHTYLFVRDVLKQSPTGAAPPGWPATWGANRVDYGMDTNIVNNAPWRNTLTNDLKSIPTLSVVLKLSDLFNATNGIYANPSRDGVLWERPMSLELIRPDGDQSRQMHINGGIRLRGGFSRNTSDPKHSFRFFFRSEYGRARLNFPFFGPDAPARFKKIDLRSNQDDSWHFTNTSGEFMRDAFSRDCLLACGQVQTHGDYYHLYINGQYWGLYTSEERPEANFMEDYFGGDAADYDVMKVEAGAYNNVATDGNTNAYFRLWQAATNGFASNDAYQRVQGNHPDGTPNPAYENLLDVPDVIDYMLCIFYAGNLDAPASTYTGNNNWYGARNRDNLHGGFRFFLHDSENSLYGLNDNRTGPAPVAGDPTRGSGFVRSNPEYLFHRLATNAEFRVLLGDHVQRHFFNGGAFTVAAVTNRYFLRRNEISRAVVVESARWGDTLREPPYTWNDWRGASDALLTNYFPQRSAIVLNQLRARGFFPSVPAPVFNQHGSSVPAGFGLVITNPSTNGGTIFFTLDGNDPRLRGGAVSPPAQAYSAPVVLNTSLEIKARIKSGTNWSAVTRAVFYVPQDFTKLLVTEIMYNPPKLGMVDGDEVEFLELKNTGTNTLNLSGLSFTSGLTFGFTNGTLLDPGGFFVLARNAAQFASKYPGVTVNGVYTGKLDNGGEPITLSHPLGATVLSVPYDDLTPWPVTPDGFGFSLVPVNPNANPDPGSAGNWRASSLPGGSPGADDPTTTIPRVLINEVLTHSETTNDFIELFNATTDTVDIGGWFLTDEPDTPMKYRIPANTMIAPLSYVRFDETQFNPTPGTNNSFSLNGLGDDVYLFSGGANTNLTGYSHGFSFNAAADGETFGRYVISTGEEQFPAQIASTPGQPNAGPRVGPLVINEIMYHPDAGGDEFIEVKNISTSAVLLYDPAFPTNAWRLNGGGFTFPTNLSLGASNMVLIVATNSAAFRAKYGIPATVAILGPSTGALQDSGERLELQRPEVPDTNGVAFITVDEVRYNDKAPWPAAADGSGPSLQRKNSAGYGNDPANWTAAVPTPGADFAGGDAPTLLTQPPSQSVVAGSNVTFSVSVNGTGPFHFVWLFNGESIPGATGATLVLSNAQPGRAGSYSVSVFNAGGSVISANATLTVLLPVAFTVQPQSQIVLPGANVTLSALAVGSGTIRYQWRFEGTNILNATNASHSFTNASIPAHHGTFSVVVADAVSTATSSNALIFVRIAPVIVLQPVGVTNLQGQTATFSVIATGAPPLSYRWLRNGVNYLSNAAPTLIITNLPPNLAGSFRVTVTNFVGTVNSTTVMLGVLADTDADGLPDFWETNYVGNATNLSATADADGDGMINRDEYIAGTNPTNALSVLKLTLTTTNTAALQFIAQPNIGYTVQYRTNLNSTVWNNLTSIAPSLMQTVQVNVPKPPPEPARFYRIVTPRVP